ncbi:MAG: alpha/beta hydrolase [Aureispira sp.]
MLFDLVFYGLLLGSTAASYWVIRSQRTKNWLLKGLKATLVLFCLSLWVWQGALLFVTKGSKFHEVARIPRHLLQLDNKSVKEGANRERIVYGKHTRQYYDYYPASKNSPHPEKVVFYLHGGGWTLGSPQQHRYLSKLLQEEGYSLIFPAYRLTPHFSYEHLQEDVNTALVHSLAMLQKKGIKDIQLFIGGTSAGGNLALLLAYDEERWKSLNLDRDQLLQGAFSIAGAIDLEKMDKTFTLQDYAGPEKSKTFALANPKTWVSPTDEFPFLCLHGTKDGLVNYAAAVSFCNEVKLFCPECVDLRSYEGLSHLEVSSSWYYRKQDRVGQDTTLLNWMERVTQAPPPLFYGE